MKKTVELLLILIYSTIIKNLVVLGDIQKNYHKDNAKFNFLPGCFVRAKGPRECIFRLSDSQKTKIFATMVPPPGNTVFMANLMF